MVPTSGELLRTPMAWVIGDYKIEIGDGRGKMRCNTEWDKGNGPTFETNTTIRSLYTYIISIAIESSKNATPLIIPSLSELS